jgi:hypothetical protein
MARACLKQLLLAGIALFASALACANARGESGGKDHEIRRSGKLSSWDNVQAKLVSNLAVFQQRMPEKNLRAKPPDVTLHNLELTFKPLKERQLRGKRRKDPRKVAILLQLWG